MENQTTPSQGQTDRFDRVVGSPKYVSNDSQKFDSGQYDSSNPEGPSSDGENSGNDDESACSSINSFTGLSQNLKAAGTDGMRYPIPTPLRPVPDWDDVRKWNSGPTRDFPPLTQVVPGRKRKQDLLPYSMDVIQVESRLCNLCGPPFDEIPWDQLLHQPICSWECGKRYFVEKLCKPVGCDLIHGKSKPNETFGRRISPDYSNGATDIDRISIS